MAQMQDELIGQVAFGYRLEEFVGSGGFGRVYRAKHPVAGKVYGVKVFPAALAGDEGFMKRFEREVAVWGRLQHPNIVEFVTAGMMESVGCPAIVMEYVEGLSLEMIIEGLERKPLPNMGAPLTIDTAVAITLELLSALEYVHGKNDVHSDVHPGNVLLGSEGVKLTDFGLTRMVREEGGGYSPHLISRPSMGLTAFASPEADRELSLTPQSDIYQAGLVLAYMLGRSPRSTKSIEQINPKVNSDLKAILEKATELQPKDRYRSAAEFAEALKAFTRSYRPISETPSKRGFPVGRLFLIAAGVAGLGILYCSLSTGSERVGDVQTPSGLEQMVAALPTDTPAPTPTDTPIPTSTPVPPTPTRTPTPTQTPTNTPVPPTPTYTPIPPTPTPTHLGKGGIVRGEGLYIQLVDYEFRQKDNPDPHAIKYTLKFVNETSTPVDLEFSQAGISAADNKGVGYGDYLVLAKKFGESHCIFIRDRPQYQIDKKLTLPPKESQTLDFFLNKNTTGGNCDAYGVGTSRIDITTDYIDVNFAAVKYRTNRFHEFSGLKWRLTR